MLVCVNAPGLIRMNAVPSSAAAWTRSISACSAFDWNEASLWPAACAPRASSVSISASVVRPYTSGSRLPSRFRFGPCRTRIFATDRLVEKRGASLIEAAQSVQFGDVRQKLRKFNPIYWLEMRCQPSLQAFLGEAAEALCEHAAIAVDQDRVGQHATGVTIVERNIAAVIGIVDQDR